MDQQNMSFINNSKIGIRGGECERAGARRGGGGKLRFCEKFSVS